ncbi:MAG: hypothetical protein NT141_03355 [candidate division WWE3 bacterium]|nr:hypothetical protein [candidate division WWE3 bacterium]
MLSSIFQILGISELILIPIIVFVILLISIRQVIWKNKFYLIVIAGLSLLFLADPFFTRGVTITQRDAQFDFIQNYIVYRDSIKQGLIPLWNNHVLTGVPALGNPLTALHYPFASLFLILEPYTAFNILLLIHFILAGVGAFLLAKKLKISSGAAICTAVVFMFNEWTISKLGTNAYIGYIFAYSWLPWCFLFILEALQNINCLRKSVIYAMLSGWVASNIINFQPNVFVYSSLAIVIIVITYLVYIFLKDRKNIVLVILTIAIVAVSIFMSNAIEIWPSYKLKSFTSNTSLTRDVTKDWRSVGITSFNDFKNTILPANYQTNQRRFSPGYIAIFLAVISLGAIFLKRYRLQMLFILFLFGLYILIGIKTPIYGLLNKFYPLFSQSGIAPSNYALLISLIALLSGFGVELLIVVVNEFLKKKNIILASLAGVIVALLIFGETWGVISPPIIILGKYLPYGIYYAAPGERVALSERFPTVKINTLYDYPHLEFINKNFPKLTVVDCFPTFSVCPINSFVINNLIAASVPLWPSVFVDKSYWSNSYIQAITNKYEAPSISSNYLDYLKSQGTTLLVTTEEITSNLPKFLKDQLLLIKIIKWPTSGNHMEEDIGFKPLPIVYIYKIIGGVATVSVNIPKWIYSSYLAGLVITLIWTIILLVIFLIPKIKWCKEKFQGHKSL